MQRGRRTGRGTGSPPWRGPRWPSVAGTDRHAARRGRAVRAEAAARPGAGRTGSRGWPPPPAGSRRSAAGASCSPRPGCWPAGGRPRTGWSPTTWRPVPGRQGRRRPDLHPGRQRVDLGRGQRRRRPRPGAGGRGPRSRAGARRRSRPRRLPSPARRAEPVQYADAGRRAHARAVARTAGLHRRQPRRRPERARPGPAGRHERASLLHGSSPNRPACRPAGTSSAAVPTPPGDCWRSPPTRWTGWPGIPASAHPRPSTACFAGTGGVARRLPPPVPVEGELMPCTSPSRSIPGSPRSTPSARTRCSPSRPAGRSPSSPRNRARSPTTGAASTRRATAAYADLPDPDVIIVPGGPGTAEALDGPGTASAGSPGRTSTPGGRPRCAAARSCSPPPAC